MARRSGMIVDFFSTPRRRSLAGEEEEGEDPASARTENRGGRGCSTSSAVREAGRPQRTTGLQPLPDGYATEGDAAEGHDRRREDSCGLAPASPLGAEVMRTIGWEAKAELCDLVSSLVGGAGAS